MPDWSAWGVRRVREGGAAPSARPEPPPHAPHTPCSRHALDPVGTGTCWPSPAPGPAGSSGQGQHRHHVWIRPVGGGLLGLGGPHTPAPLAQHAGHSPLLGTDCPSSGCRIFVLRSNELPLITTTTATFYMSRKRFEQSLGI